MSAETLTAPGQSALRPASTGHRGRLACLIRGRADDASWVRPSLLALLLGTALLYLWGLGDSGWANSFYSAAAQAGSDSWKAMFFGSSDAANSITVDKTPASLWIMAISVRVFGLSSWSILVPQALEGVAAVGMLYLAVRRTAGSSAGLLSGAILALTPVAALMFRFNNPDALLVLLMTVSAYCLIRAIEKASTSWLVLVGVLTGFGFLTKMLQALLVVPAFAIAYLIAAPNPVRRRIVQLLAAGGALVVSAGWWVAIVELTPARYRPYIGGSQHNSILELTLGYNGFGRLTGNETGSVGGAAAQGGRWGATGWTRLFGTDMGTQIAWLLPASLVLLGAALWFTRRAPRTDAVRAALIAWGGWLVVTGIVFSMMRGIVHAYYTVALAPAIGAVIGIGAVLLWRRRQEVAARAVLAATLAITGCWQFALLGRTPDWLPWLRYLVLMTAVACALLLLGIKQFGAKAATTIASIGVVATLLAPAGYAISTARTPHAGAIPTAGPASTSGFGGPGGGAGRGGRPGAPPAGLGTGGGFRGGGGGAAGGLLNASTPSAAVVSALTSNASNYTWVAATVGSNSAAGFQLATQLPVMAIGGFNGSDPSPSLAEFTALVASGKIHYFIAGGGTGRGQTGGSQSASDIASWVQSTFSSTTVGGVTLYDLTAS